MASSPAAAQVSVSPLPWLTPAEEELAFAVAKVSFNEAGDGQDDLLLIWTITEGHGRNARRRQRWLECHSNRVLGRPDCRVHKVCRETRNCHWTRNLRRDGSMPEGWLTVHSERWWRYVQRRRWLVHLERTQWVVSGYKAHNPCGDIVPFTWGSEADVARKVAAGWSYYGCGKATNYGFSRPVRP